MHCTALQVIVVAHLLRQHCQCVLWVVDSADLVESNSSRPGVEVVAAELQQLQSHQ
jgi:hypothetical protein